MIFYRRHQRQPVGFPAFGRSEAVSLSAARQLLNPLHECRLRAFFAQFVRLRAGVRAGFAVILEENYVPLAVADLDADHLRLLDSLRSLMMLASRGSPPLEDMRAGVRRFLAEAEAHFASE